MKLGAKWGAIDKTGRFVVKPQFDDMGNYHEGLVPVKQGEKWGLADKAGKIVYPFQFDEISDFCEGLAAADDKGYWGFIDRKTLKLSIPCLSKNAPRDFHDGLVAVQSKDNKWGFIDKSGKFVVPTSNIDEARSFSDGLAWVRGPQYGGFAYLGTDGKLAIKLPAGTTSASDFADGVACITVKEKTVWIDKTGKPITPKRETGASDEGLTSIERNGKYGYTDGSGKLVIPARFFYANSFHDGLAAVQAWK